MVVRKVKSFRSEIKPGPSDGSTVGKCRNHSFHPRLTMRFLMAKVGQSTGNRPVKF